MEHKRRVNAGGPAFDSFEASTGFVGGTAVDRGAIPIAGTGDDTLYQTELFDVTSFSIAVPNRRYAVKVHMAETFLAAEGERTFDLSIQGNLCLHNFDIFAEAGAANTAVVKTIVVDANNGRLDLTWVAGIQLPVVNAIEILEVEPATALTPVVSATPGTGPDTEIGTGRTRTANSVATIKSQYAQCDPGDTLRIANNTYDFGGSDGQDSADPISDGNVGFLMDQSGEGGVGKKIFVQAATPGGVTFLNSLVKISGRFH